MLAATTFPLLDKTQNDLIPFRNSYYNSLNSNYNLSNNNSFNDKNDIINNKQIKFASFLYKQCYETPYLPCGYYLKFILSSNYYKGNVPIEETDIKYFDIGFNKIEIYDEDGKNITNNDYKNIDNNISDNSISYKIISNCEIVDDEENNLSFMTRCLHNEPYELVKSSSGIEALQLIKNGQHFDVILSDHKMPEMFRPDNSELLQYLCSSVF